jgi:DNA-binding XRE family transcriptional regulator
LAFFGVEQKTKTLVERIENPQNTAEHLRKRRLQLKLKQAEVAILIGVSEDCITYWENNRSQPQINQYPKIIQFLGYNPFPLNENTFGGKIKKYRIEHGLSHKQLGKRLGVDPSTIGSWEDGKTFPSSLNLKKLQKEFIN